MRHLRIDFVEYLILYFKISTVPHLVKRGRKTANVSSVIGIKWNVILDMTCFGAKIMLVLKLKSMQNSTHNESEIQHFLFL